MVGLVDWLVHAARTNLLNLQFVYFSLKYFTDSMTTLSLPNQDLPYMCYRETMGGIVVYHRGLLMHDPFSKSTLLCSCRNHSNI